MDVMKKQLKNLMAQSLCNCEFLQKKFEVDIDYLESLKYSLVGQYYRCKIKLIKSFLLQIPNISSQMRQILMTNSIISNVLHCLN